MAATRRSVRWDDRVRGLNLGDGGLYQVAPVGMFQPSHDAAWNLSHDFSLWRSIVRELSEELLGAGEDYHSDAAPIDYQRERGQSAVGIPIIPAMTCIGSGTA